MPRFAANLSLLYPEYDFLDRFAAAAADGFEAVEFLFPYAYPPQTLADRLQSHGLQQALFNMSAGQWDAGERGIACLGGRETEFRTRFLQALEYADRLNCLQIHVMAGLVPEGVDLKSAQDTYTRNLDWAAAQAAPAGRTVLIEPINQRDMPGYFLSRQSHAHAIVAQVGAANLKVQMDLYHCQIVEGDLSQKLAQYVPTGNVAHIQIAGVPLRHEPDLGEVHYPHLFAMLDMQGYDGWIGCEYRPADSLPGGTSRGLRWRNAYFTDTPSPPPQTA